MTTNPNQPDRVGAPGVAGQAGVPGYADTTTMVQQAFQNGWIDIDDLDRRLQGIASASSPLAARAFVADLEEPFARAQLAERKAEKQKASNCAKAIGMSVPFYAACGVFALCVLIWLMIVLSAGVH